MSTGTLINKLSSRNDKKINFFGIDSVKNMVLQAKKKIKLKKSNKEIYAWKHSETEF